MTREEQDQALAAMGFLRRDIPEYGWRKACFSGWDLYIYPLGENYLARAIKYTPRYAETFEDPIAAAAYLLIQAADQP